MTTALCLLLLGWSLLHLLANSVFLLMPLLSSAGCLLVEHVQVAFIKELGVLVLDSCKNTKHKGLGTEKEENLETEVLGLS